MANFFEQGLFHIDPNTTPEQLERKRERVRKFFEGGSSKSVADGLVRLAGGVWQGLQERKRSEFESERRGEAQELFDRVMETRYGRVSDATGGTPFFGFGQSPDTTGAVETAPIPDTPEAVAADTRAVLGFAPQATDVAYGGELDGTAPADALTLLPYQHGGELSPEDAVTTGPYRGEIGPNTAPIPAGGSAMPASLIRTESGGKFNALNNEIGAGGVRGHGGRGQFGFARLQDAARAGVIPAGTTPQQFAQMPPEVQIAVENWHFADIDRAIERSGAARMIGQDLDGDPSTPDIVTQNGLRAVAHLGGTGGMQKFVETRGAYNPSDSFGTSLRDYLVTHGQGGGGNTAMAFGGGAPAPNYGAMNFDTGVGELYAALSNPWMTADQKAMIRGEITRREQQNDPLRQLQLAEAQQRLYQLHNPPPREMDIRELADGRSYYIDPTGQLEPRLVNPRLEVPREEGWVDLTPEQKQAMGIPVDEVWQRGPGNALKQIGGGGTNVTVNNGGQSEIGTIPQGYELVTDPVTGERSMRQIPGGPEDTSMSSEMAADKALQSLELIDAVRNSPALASVTGMLQGRMPPRNQEGTDLLIKIEQLQGQAFMQAFESLKGGGQITEKEGQAATAAIARLDRRQSEEAYRAALDELYYIMDRARMRSMGQDPGEYNFGGTTGGRTPLNPGETRDVGGGVTIRRVD